MRRVVFKVSGYQDHPGRPGLVGGSLPREGVVIDEEYLARRARANEALRRSRAKKKAELAAKKAAPLQERYNVAQMFAEMPAVISDNEVKIKFAFHDTLSRMQAHYPMLNEDMLKRMFYMKDMKATVNISGGKLSASWTDKRGFRVASQEITVNADTNNAYFNLLSVDNNAQAQNFGMPLVIKQVAMTKLLGFKTASMYADLSIGRYAWAKEGVSYRDEGAEIYARSQYAQFVDNVARYDMDFESYQKLKADKSYMNFDKPVQWAKYDVPGITIKSQSLGNNDVKPGNYPVGKAFMLSKDSGHGSWYAVIDLSKIGF